jgi:hypothetical protein
LPLFEGHDATSEGVPEAGAAATKLAAAKRKACISRSKTIEAEDTRQHDKLAMHQRVLEYGVASLVDAEHDIESCNDGQQELHNATDQRYDRAEDTREGCNDEDVEAPNKIGHSVQQVSDHGLDGADGVTSKEDDNSNQGVQNSQDQSQETVNRGTEAGEIKTSQVNLGNSLELHDTGRYNSSDLDHNVRDGVRCAGVTLEVCQLSAQRLNVGGRVGDDGNDGLKGSIIAAV